MYKLVDHTAKCQADAIISAIQNLRDSNVAVGRRQFHDAVFGGVAEEWAEYYLNEGMQPCRCPAGEVKRAATHRMIAANGQG